MISATSSAGSAPRSLRSRPAFFEESLKVLPLDELHRDKPGVIGLADVEDPHHVPVGHLSGENDLLLEALQDIRVVSQVRPDDLEGHHAVELQISRSVHRPHAAEADQLFDPIAIAENSARIQGAGRCHRLEYRGLAWGLLWSILGRGLWRGVDGI
jgi:hypothetical protein